MNDDQGARAELFHALATHAARSGLGSLSDDELLLLLDEHRWAVGRLADDTLPMDLRSLLNAAVVKSHGLVHRRPRRRRARVGPALRSVSKSLGIAAAVFFGSTCLAFAVVVGDPVLALSILPREFLAEIDTSSWGARGGVQADTGATFFYWANNLRASFLALGLGLLGGIPSLLVLAVNGALLGAVAGVAASRDVGHRLLGWIAPHGVPELGALILCGAIGLELGLSWIEPGWRLRRSALARTGRRLTPLTVVAAVLVICAAPLEGYVAPLELPPWLDLSIALLWVVVLGLLARHALRR